VTSLTWTTLNLLCNTGPQLLPGRPAVLACRVLPRSDVILCTFPLAQPVVSIWFTPLGRPRGSLLVFPGLHIVLLDSDCVPVTLFGVEDLWQEAQRLQHSGFPGLVTTSSCAGV